MISGLVKSLLKYKPGLMALAGGIISGLAYPPWGFYLLVPVGFMLLYLAVDRAGSWLEAGRSGLLFGIVFYLLHTYWFYSYSPLVLPLILSVLGLYFALWAVVLRLSKGSLYIAVAGWIGVEWLLEVGLFGQRFVAFPWSRIAMALAARTELIQPVRWMGEYLWGGLWLFTALAFAAWLTDKCRLRTVILSGTVLLIFLIAGFYGFYSMPPQLTEREVLIVQPDVSSVDPAIASPGELQRQRLAVLTLAGAQPGDLVVWPETVLVRPSFRVSDQQLEWPDIGFKNFIEQVTNRQFDIFLGATVYDPKPRELDYLNAALLVDRDLDIAGFYTKRIPVPGGEYFPLMGRYGWLERLARRTGTHGYRPGKKGGLIELESASELTKIGVQICYESAFNSLVRNQVKAGADLLITISNDSWSRSRASHVQHGYQARMRAVETARPLLRAGNTGVSAIIGPRGRFISYLSPYQQGTIRARLPEPQQIPFYTRYGDWVTLAAVLILLLLGIIEQNWITLDKRSPVDV